jgi:hypothetical protein
MLIRVGWVNKKEEKEMKHEEEDKRKDYQAPDKELSN